MNYRWQIRDRAPSSVVNDLARQTGLNPILLHILHQRGITTPSEIDYFLAPDLSTGHDPFLLKGMEEAVTRIRSAVTAGEPIRIHGDYDVDGVTAVALMVRVLQRFGACVDAHIPHRTEEGYGLSLEAVEKAHAEGIRVLVTVDCGISAATEAERARELGIDLIVTDHHTPGPETPQALAVINPRQEGCSYPFKDLCGVGLAFKLACALEPPGTEPAMLEFLDLVALGTTADVVPLLDENRIFVKYGLPQLGRSRWPGLEALIDRVDLRRDRITATQAVFNIAPRINAAGRMADASDALTLLLTDDPFRAAQLARHLDEQNALRRKMDRSTLKRAQEMVDSQGGVEGRYALVLCSENWHPGVIGIVASRLAEIYNLPTVLVAMDGDDGRGSARSIEGFDLYDALSGCAQHLVEFGGHPRAAGLSLTRCNISAFTEAFECIARNRLMDRDLQPVLHVNYEVQEGDLTHGLLSDLKRLEPYGAGNRRPVFMLSRIELEGTPRRVGPSRSHLKFSIKCDHDYPLDAIGFGLGDSIDELSGRWADIVFAFEENEFRGIRRPQLRIKDLRKVSP
ncbi:MAG: single-stranded-DNA-specific exonuclease RecJ [Candidatus Latescibacteria bacterium]|nr:single-stranded-DNA-specific exonuclease RecJ [Candidatus Latescibacterota bacterium]